MLAFSVASGGQLVLVVVVRERDHTWYWYEHAAVTLGRHLILRWKSA
jgi:hypothetical protein